MITRRQAIAALVTSSVAAPAVLRAQDTVTWTVYSYVPAATVAPAKVFQEIIERVSKETNGGFQMKYHLGGALTIKATDITTAVGDNVIQIGDDGFQQVNGPITGILRLPMLITSTAEFEKALAIMKPYVERAYDKRGSTVLSTYYFPFQIAWSSKKLTSLDELKGLKIRATLPEQIEFLKRFLAPIGINMFVIQSIWDGRLSDIVWGTIPFHLLMFVLLVMLMMWPEIALRLPAHMGKPP